jgi:hypothetical protein
MAGRTDEQSLELLKDHLDYIKERFSPEKIILFGSRARGDNLIDSDIDILIISSRFGNMKWRERIMEAFDGWDRKQMLDCLCYTPEEFEEKKKGLGIVRRAFEEGIEI